MTDLHRQRVTTPDLVVTRSAQTSPDPLLEYKAPPRCPHTLLAADLPDWAKLVWLAVRSVQGGNAEAWADYTHYGSLCGKSLDMARKAIGLLKREGWIEEVRRQGNTRVLRCHDGTEGDREQGSQNERPGMSDREQGSQVTGNAVPSDREQGSHSPTPPNKEESVQEPVQESVQPREAREGGGGPIPYDEIVDHLNATCGTGFRATGKATRKLIRARWNEGFRLADFLAVHEAKARQWLKDPKMREYLRPVTLYQASKFESYLNGHAGTHPTHRQKPADAARAAHPGDTHSRLLSILDGAEVG